MENYTTNDCYTANDIDVLEGLEGVRKRPHIYVGDVHRHALFQIIKEAVDNCVDEFLVGSNDKCFIILDKDRMSVLVADRGRGIPVEDHPKTGISTLTTVLTKIHAGGKFSGKKMTVGTHGVGISATNALSIEFEIWTYRAAGFNSAQEGTRRAWYYQKFSEGVPQGPVQEGISPPTPWDCGTVVRFTPDSKIFTKSYRLPIKRLEDWLYILKFLCPGLEFVLQTGETITQYRSNEGIARWVMELIENDNLGSVGKMFEYNEYSLYSNIFPTLQVALQWTNSEDEGIRTFVNCCPTPEHGSHFVGLRKALNDALAPFSAEKYNKEDLRLGLVGVLHLRMEDPTYDTQTKDKLSSDSAEERVKSSLTSKLIEFFQKNRALADTIIEKAVKLRQAREKFRQEKDAVRNITTVSRNARHVLPCVLLGAPRCKPKDRELFICEGKSAKGTLKDARDPSYQEVLPLKGKFTNACKYPPSKVFQNQDILNMFTAIGSNQSAKDPSYCDPKKARVGKILLLPDEDDDGKHIRCLELALFLYYMRELILAGMVYVVDAPLYVTSYGNKKFYGKTLEGIKGQIPTSAKVFITRMKGWGECAAQDMKYIACNPNTRVLHQVTLTDTCADRIEELMGSDSIYRKKLLGV